MPVKAGSRPPAEKGKARRKTPWLALLLLVGSIYLFWILPLQLGSRTPKVEFTNEK